MYVHHMHNWSQRGQKGAWDPLKIMLQVKCHVSAGKRIWVLAANHLSSLLWVLEIAILLSDKSALQLTICLP